MRMMLVLGTLLSVLIYIPGPRGSVRKCPALASPGPEGNGNPNHRGAILSGGRFGVDYPGSFRHRRYSLDQFSVADSPGPREQMEKILALISNWMSYPSGEEDPWCFACICLKFPPWSSMEKLFRR